MFRLSLKPLSGRTILVVENDQDLIHQYIDSVLLEGGRVAGCVSSVCEASTFIDRQPVDGIIIHTRLAALSKTGLLQLLPHRCIDVIYVTGFDDWYENEDVDCQAVSFG